MSATVAKKRQRSREREPDWDNFYKNGLPKEIIVIDDSPEPSAAAIPQHNGRSENRGENGHTAKKRRRDDVGTAYDPVYHLDRSNEHTPGYNSASKSTISTDRTTSAIHTTAATSLGSHSSNGQNGYDDAEPHSGQKRKRTNTRLQLANEAKKREAETYGDAFTSYRPPPYPPIKAPEVAVKQIPDVCASTILSFSTANMSQTSYTKNSKVDDDDGHYIVVPDSDLTERCKSYMVYGA
jgi:dual-specificity kinase